MSRKVIPNVPELKYDGNNAAYFTNILDAVLQGMNEACDKAQLTASAARATAFAGRMARGFSAMSAWKA